MTDVAVLERIAGFVTPPAWTDVWVAQDARAHLQVTGHDTVGRKQYRYHPAWDEIRSLTKFSRLQAFGEKLLALRQQLQRDLARPALSCEQVVALVISLIDK